MDALARQFDLTVVASTNKIVDGLKDVTTNLEFRSIRVPEIPEYGWRPRHDLYHPDLLSIIRDETPDILISFSSSLDRLLTHREALATIRQKQIKTIWMGCDGYLNRNPYLSLIKELSNPKRALKTIRNIRALSRVDHCLPYSSHTARYLHQARFVPQAKISVAANAIDTTVIRQTIAKLENAGETRNPLGLVFLGRLTARKGVATLLRAFAEILSRFPHAHLDLIGEGSESQALKQLADSLGLSPEHVTFVGPLYDDAALSARLYRSTVAVMPGLGGLGFNSAMAAGLPIVYTQADGTEADLIQEGENGWYFDGTVTDLTRALTQALNNPARSQQMGQRSAQLITTTFNLENMVRVYAETIRHLYEKTS